MLILILSFFIAAFGTLFVVRSAKQYAHLSHDHDISGPQKFHATPVPRVGGIGIVFGVLGAQIAMIVLGSPAAGLLALVLVSAVPTFASGLTEDMTKNVSPRRRLVFTAVSALLGVFLVDGVIDRLGFAAIDPLFALPVFAAVVTVFAISGVTNAINIIDGFNGLASMCVVLMLAAIGYVAFQVGDHVLLMLVMALVGSVLGFFLWNFPAGLIFLGDGGAYFLGFVASELAIMLIHRNRSVSPMFPLLVCIYPIFETIFSIYRKKFIRKMSPSVPDGVHLHMLVYKRLMRWAFGQSDAKAMTRRNSMTSPYLWVLCTIPIVPAVLFWDHTAVLLTCICGFAALYVTLYWRIVRFRSPRWLVRSSRP